MSDTPLKTWIERDGKLLRLRLARPKANIIDAEMIAALDAAFAAHVDNAGLSGVLLDHEGPHFSFGASVAEHLPDQCADMLAALHALIKRMVRFPVPVMVAVRGQCLGGGLEVAMAGSMIFAAPDAMLGQPEIKVGVFAPAASCLMPPRTGQSRAEDLLFSGRSAGADEALRIGLVDRVDDDPEAAALTYFDANLAPHSASVLRFAQQAARAEYISTVCARLDAVEKLYLEGLMKTRDAVEGLNAFLEKRPAQWENR
ncbi:MAG: cyclohexa-1,5-dienecarbonyl-CoA hydratase [Rhodospirillales bacterium]|nr:cyclohexa-1,5-dienecarbonyl-CoA hydratase [Rhodospirillales bacterium]MCW8861558.1 cyclohexa-1,5-dienecarbonyl-CoA hydratase [Rhodospirillales bacterium]MCW8952153.1 cyclohexa-1,5-dienecarbonyl-CoA hydratase [Rhodospirillales bacterium]MCW8970293.1 cyclohexa-1,5-dienecarbonyl-CoA hydratase [Rhodospirillales bacterium]MCW9001445.1 cyclohexa-1,5-dienecarbonyl-CoA hydratase [Rhodospirillales bacterium]